MKITDSTLGLPRILCLHGGGTNSRIFRMQCRVLESTLSSTFRLVYAEAPFPSQPGSDVTSVYQKHGPFKSWLQSTESDNFHDQKHTIECINAAIADAMETDSKSGAKGEWVALLGFSQGAKLAASVLFVQQTLQQRAGAHAAIWPNFRFAVLMAGRGPLVCLLSEQSSLSSITVPVGSAHGDIVAPFSSSESRALSQSALHVLQVPTIHVHGLQDPGLRLHRALKSDYFKEELASTLEWDGDHRVPIKRKDVDAVVQEIYALAKATGVLQIHY